jgi:hypothetical protein
MRWGRSRGRPADPRTTRASFAQLANQQSRGESREGDDRQRRVAEAIFFMRCAERAARSGRRVREYDRCVHPNIMFWLHAWSELRLAGNVLNRHQQMVATCRARYLAGR